MFTPPQCQSRSVEPADYLESARAAGRRAAQRLAVDAASGLGPTLWLSGFVSGFLNEVVSSDAAAEAARRSSAEPGADDMNRSLQDPARTGADNSSPEPVTPEPGETETLPSSELTLRGRVSLAAESKASGLSETSNIRYSARDPFSARIEQLQPNGSRPASLWRMVLESEGSGLRCRPGSLLCAVPNNDAEHVRKLLRRLKAKGQETVTTELGTGPAWRALLEEFSLTTVTPELLCLLAANTKKPEEAAQLERLAKSGQPFVGTLMGLLRRFPGVRPGLGELVKHLSPLQPQRFPLASAHASRRGYLEALVVKSKHETRSVVDAIDTGKLNVGDWLPVFVECKPYGHPPSDATAPALIVAPGAAAACACSFLAEREVERSSGRNWLFTSCTPGDRAPPYIEEFSAWQTSRVLTRLDVSESSQLALRLTQQADMVHAWLVDGSFVYVFGTAAECGQIHTCFSQLLMSRLRISVEEAAARLSKLQVAGHFRMVVTE